MERVASFAWQTPPPTSIDEELVLYDDGSAWLVVRRPAADRATMGTFAFTPDRAEFDRLVEDAPGSLVFDMLHVPGEMADLQSRARAMADAARATPIAVATFQSRPLGAPTADQQLRVALAVVAAGQRAIEFELEPEHCAVHLSNMGQPVVWHEFPPLETGFITPDAEGLGGLRDRASVAPGQFGALVLAVPSQAGVSAISIQAAGSLYDALPDGDKPARFEIRTEEVDIGQPA